MNTLTPTRYYQQLLAKNILQADIQQEKIIEHFEALYHEILQQKSSWWKKVLNIKQTPRGYYLWGGVGIGKTRMMDIFFECLPGTKKLRTHFHRFMKDIHESLRHYQGHKNPLRLIASDIARCYQIICFDEFFVVEITDAMILAELLTELFHQGMVLVITSNVAPDDLYKNGLQRGRFIPAIELIKQHMQITHLNISKDYRLRTLQQAGVFYTPLNYQTKQQLKNQFEQLATSTIDYHSEIIIQTRSIPVIAKTQDMVWFDFSVICHAPRSQVDYIEIAHLYHTVFVSNIPQIRDRELDTVRYLINLIDVFYDANVIMVISSAVNVLDIYPKGFLWFEFQRTQSRLLEMQSQEYICRRHNHETNFYDEVKSTT
ncbi:MAG: AFG1 family ATPase [Legionellales bacterium]|nr:AFG1 family ATPase [Legionellales bacterium]